MPPLIDTWLHNGEEVKVETAPLPGESAARHEARHQEAVNFWMGLLRED